MDLFDFQQVIELTCVLNSGEFYGILEQITNVLLGCVVREASQNDAVVCICDIFVVYLLVHPQRVVAEVQVEDQDKHRNKTP